jgi:hypothetical protein
MADPTVSNVYQTSIPQELLPYARTMLDTASEFTDIAKNPYQQYQGERVAQLSPLTQQSMDTASQMGVSGQIGAGTNLAGAAGLSALGTQYDPNQFQTGSFTNPYAAASYMSPFMQNVVDVQQQQAKRQAAIQSQAQQGQATQAGAFGGGRDAIMRAQGNADLQRNLQGIQATGLQNAFQNAQQQFNTENSLGLQAQQMGEQSRQFGANLGMQGLQTGLQAANALGNLGQEQFQQTANVVGMQNQLGQQEQQRNQEVLNNQYQDFLNYQNYPYKQLGFMSDLIRGTPTTQSASTMYQAPPTMTQNLMSLGLGAYGINQLAKGANGGEVRGYAGGGMVSFDDGGSVMSPGFKRYAVDHIDPRQLPMAQRNAMARGDRETADYATDEMALDAAIRRGIGAAFTPQMADHIVRAAGGGILSFSGDDDGTQFVKDAIRRDDFNSQGKEDWGTPTAGDGEDDREGSLGTAQPDIVREGLRQNRKLAQFQPETMTPEQEEAAWSRAIARERKVMGPNTANAELKKYLEKSETERGAAFEQGKGLAALKAMGAVLQPGGTMRGLGAAGSAFADSYGQAQKADREEKRALAMAGYHLADSERKERAGEIKSADAALAAHKASLKDANRFNFDKLKAQADLTARLAQATRPLKGAGEHKPSTQAEGVSEYYNYFKETYPDETPAQLRKRAMDKYLEMKGSGLAGVTTRTEATAEEKARERTAKRALTDPGINEALRKKDTAAADKRRAAILAEEIKKPPEKPGVIKLD